VGRSEKQEESASDRKTASVSGILQPTPVQHVKNNFATHFYIDSAFHKFRKFMEIPGMHRAKFTQA